MKNDNLNAILTELAENAAPTSRIDLWPTLKDRLATSESRLKQGDASMKTDSSRTPSLRRIALLLTAIAIAFAILLATPQGRAWAQSILRFFTRAESDTLPAPTSQPLRWVDLTTPGASHPTLTPLPSPTGLAISADCGDLPIPKCSTEQIRSQVNFPIKELGTIPERLYFIGAIIRPEGVLLIYDTADHSGAVSLVQSPWTGNPEQTAWKVGPSANVETVKINGLPGEYVRGSFTMNDGDPTMTWDGNSDDQTLHWVDHGVFVEMRSSGSVLPMDRDAFVSLAETLTTKPISAGSPPLPTPNPEAGTYTGAYPDYNLTIAEVGKQAGIDIRQPGKLPESLLFGGATYDQKNRVISIVYLQDQEARLQGLANGLTLSQQISPDPNDCKLCGMLVGDNAMMVKDQFQHLVIAPEANLETVQIGTLTGQYVEGHWIGSDCCGWVWTKEDIKTLRWWKNGTAFELSELGTGLTKADLIAIAESLK